MTTDRPDRYRLTRREAVRLAVLAPAAGLVLTACGREEPLIQSLDGGEPDRPGREDVQELLDRRAEAQLRGDEERYLADLDPSNEDLIRRERMVFANLRQFPLEDVRLLLDDAARRQVSQQLRSAPYRVGPVIKVVRLSADDASEGVLGPGEAFEYVLDRRDGAWQVTDILPVTSASVLNGGERQPGDPLLGPGLLSLKAGVPWNLGPLQVVNVRNVWLVGDESVTDLDRWAAAAEAEVQQVEAMWGERPQFPGHVLFFTRDRATFGAWYEFAESDLPQSAEGFASRVFGVRQNGEVYTGEAAGSRMVIFLPFHEDGGLRTQTVMRHELVHAVSSRVMSTTGTFARGSGSPSWAVEGFARFFDTRGDAEREAAVRAAVAAGVRDGRFTGEPEVTSRFYDGDSATVSFNYALGSTVFRFIEQMRDLETAIDFYAEVIKRSEGLDPYVRTPDFDRLCRQILGMSGPDFLHQWAEFVRGGSVR